MQRRELVRILEEAGFISRGGTNHKKFVKGDKLVLVKRHRDRGPDSQEDFETGGASLAPPLWGYVLHHPRKGDLNDLRMGIRIL